MFVSEGLRPAALHLLPFALAAGAAYLLTWLVRLLAPRLGLMDIPRGDRWHRRPVPRLGGISIYLAFTGVLLLFLGPPYSRQVLALLLSGGAVFLVGLLDDLVRLENRPKLILLILSAVTPALVGVRFELFAPVVGTVLAVLWILGATNAFNWLDNMDGVAGGVAVIAAVNLTIVSTLVGDAASALLAVILAGAVLGFLVHNFPPARVFMGDSGSGLLGATLAIMAVLGSYREVSNVLLTILVPVLILSVPLFDTALVTVLRVLHRRSIFQGGRDHPAHRLVALGLPERKAVLLLYGLSALAGTVGLLAASLGFMIGVTVAVLVILVFTAVGFVLAEVRIYEGPLPRPGLTLLPGPFRNKRWISVMLLDVVLVSAAYIGAHLLRYEGALPHRVADNLERTLPFVLAVKMASFYLTGAYRGVWRYAGILDLARLVRSSAVGSILSVVVLFLMTNLDGFSRTALVLDWMLTLLFLAGSRLSLRLIREYLAALGESGRRVLIFGAGRGGSLVLEELRQNPGLGYRPLGFIDDDPAKRGMILQGLPVFGTRHDLRELIPRHRVDEVLLAAPSCPPPVLQEVVSVCQTLGVKAKQVRLTVMEE